MYRGMGCGVAGFSGNSRTMRPNSLLAQEDSSRESGKRGLRKAFAVSAMLIPALFFLFCFFDNLTAWQWGAASSVPQFNPISNLVPKRVSVSPIVALGRAIKSMLSLSALPIWLPLFAGFSVWRRPSMRYGLLLLIISCVCPLFLVIFHKLIF